MGRSFFLGGQTENGVLSAVEMVGEKQNMKKLNSFIIPIIRKDFLPRCLETLYKYTPPNFYVFVIDQTPDGIHLPMYKDYIHMYIRPYRNLGFSKAINTGIILSQTPYVTALNDDVEFINDTWWQGIEDTFKMDERIIAVNPNSPKEGAWGYGLTQENKDTWVPREGFVRDNDGRSVVPVVDGVTIDTPQKAIEHYDGLLNRNPIWSKDTLCDALACWCTVFKASELKKIGLFDEKFYPGGGEDYCKMAEIYSCAWPYERDECNPIYHQRAVGTTKSWVWHWWGKSKDDVSGKEPDNKLFESRSRWNNLEEIWGDKFDVWGHYTDENGNRKPITRKQQIFIDEL